MINIENFSGKGDVRNWMSSPFLIGSKAVATNGHIMIISTEIEYLKRYARLASDQGINVTKHIDQIDAVQAWESPNKETIHFPEKIECNVCRGTGKATKTCCPECDGEGRVDVDNDFSTYYDLECRTCGGDGFTVSLDTNEQCPECFGTGKRYEKYAKVTVLGVNVQAKYLSLIIDEPGLELAVNNDKNGLFFRAGKASGIILGLMG